MLKSVDTVYTMMDGAMATGRGQGLSWTEEMWVRYTADVPDELLYHLNMLFVLLVFSLAPLPSLALDLFFFPPSRILHHHTSSSSSTTTTATSTDSTLIATNTTTSSSSLSPSSRSSFVYQPLVIKKFILAVNSLGPSVTKIQPSVRHPPSAMLRCYKAVMLSFLTVVLPLHLSSFPVAKFVGIRTSLPLPSFYEVALQIIVYFLIEDYGHYWIHRWLHTEWAYNKIHYMHHEFKAPIGFAAPYAHWAEVLLLGIPSFIGPLVVPGHMVTLWLWFAFRQTEAIYIHNGYEVSWSPTKLIPFFGGSEYHDYHHYLGGKSNSNFASVFTYCDYIYGTNKAYRYKKNMMMNIMKD